MVDSTGDRARALHHRIFCLSIHVKFFDHLVEILLVLFLSHQLQMELPNDILELLFRYVAAIKPLRKGGVTRIFGGV